MASMMLVLVVVLTAGGPWAYALSHAFSNGESTRQGYIYDSMVWVQNNAPTNSTVISVGFPLEYRYLFVVTSRNYGGEFPLNATGVMSLHSRLQFNYVVVSTSFGGINTFYHSDVLRPEYQNPDVVIFQVFA